MALTEDGHAGQSYAVTGPDAPTFAEALDVFEEYAAAAATQGARRVD